jgi:hypothetical protein
MHTKPSNSESGCLFVFGRFAWEVLTKRRLFTSLLNVSRGMSSQNDAFLRIVERFAWKVLTKRRLLECLTKRRVLSARSPQSSAFFAAWEALGPGSETFARLEPMGLCSRMSFGAQAPKLMHDWSPKGLRSCEGFGARAPKPSREWSPMGSTYAKVSEPWLRKLRASGACEAPIAHEFRSPGCATHA